MCIEAAAAPALIVRSVERAAAFYGVKLGFAIIYPKRNPDVDLIVLCPGGGELRFKEVGGNVQPVHIRRDADPQWDALVRVSDAAALARDFAAHEVAVTPQPSSHGRPGGFQISDPDGNILHFADYACVPLKLVIEVDGPVHDAARDSIRDHRIERRGFHVLRFGVQEID